VRLTFEKNRSQISKALIYTEQNSKFLKLLVIVKVIGSFRLKICFWNLHQNFKFTKLKNMTTNESLRVSCGTIFIRQGISLLYHTQNNTVIYHRLHEKQVNFSFYPIDIGHSSNYIHFL